jgi:transcriptional regulator with XRE-family HTH domain
MTSLAKALQQRRRELGHSQERAGVYCGTTRQTYAKWESGDDYPRTFDRVPEIAGWLNMEETDVSLMVLEAMHHVPRIGDETRTLSNLPSDQAFQAA